MSLVLRNFYFLISFNYTTDNFDLHLRLSPNPNSIWLLSSSRKFPAINYIFTFLSSLGGLCLSLYGIYENFFLFYLSLKPSPALNEEKN
jgi:hypothetical protein